MAKRAELTASVTPDSVVDHVAAYSIYFCDPFGHRLELTTYEYEQTKRLLALANDRRT
jgi:hypothetical protein